MPVFMISSTLQLLVQLLLVLYYDCLYLEYMIVVALLGSRISCYLRVLKEEWGRGSPQESST